MNLNEPPCPTKSHHPPRALATDDSMRYIDMIQNTSADENVTLKLAASAAQLNKTVHDSATLANSTPNLRQGSSNASTTPCLKHLSRIKDQCNFHVPRSQVRSGSRGVCVTKACKTAISKYVSCKTEDVLTRKKMIVNIIAALQNICGEKSGKTQTVVQDVLAFILCICYCVVAHFGCLWCKIVSTSAEDAGR